VRAQQLSEQTEVETLGYLQIPSDIDLSPLPLRAKSRLLREVHKQQRRRRQQQRPGLAVFEQPPVKKLLNAIVSAGMS